MLSKTLIYGDVRLRPMQEEEIEKLWSLYDPKIFLHMLHKVENFEQFKKWLNPGITQMNDLKTAMAFVVEHADTNELMGTTRIYDIDETNHACEIGSTFLGVSFQRTHVNTACKYMMLQYCFEELGMIRVQFKTDELNVNSQRAIERIGGVKEGLLRNERIRSNGTVRNAVVYSIIESEWPEVKKNMIAMLNKYS